MLGPRRVSLAHTAAVASVLLALCSLIAPAAAIYEDQAGTFDWHKQFVGRPQTVLFSPGKERVFLTTGQNLVASLQTKTGSIAWRRQYTQHDSLDSVLVLQQPSLVLAASNGGKTLRAWDALEGGFRWEAVVYEGPAAASPGLHAGLVAVTLQGAKYPAVAVAAGNTIKLLGSSKGDELWSATLEDEAADATHKMLLAGDGDVTLVAYTPGSRQLVIARYAAADGSSRGEVVQLTAAAALAATSAVSGHAVALLSADGQQVCGWAGGAEVSCADIASLAPSLSGGELRLAAAASGSFTLTSPAGVAIVSISSGSGEGGAALQTVHSSQTSAAVATPAAVDGDSTAADSMLLAVASSTSSSSSSVNIQLLSAASGQQVAAADVQVPPPTHPTSGVTATLVAGWLDASRRNQKGADSSSGSNGPLSGVRVLLLWSDDSLTFVEDGEVVWGREEALASVSSSLLVELPTGKAAAAKGAAASDDDGSSGSSGGSKGGLLGFLQDRERLRSWVRLQMLSVLVQFKLNTDAERGEFDSLRQQLSDNNLPYRDTNGFRRLIVVLTGPGKLFGLHSGDGRILWSSTIAAAGSSGSDGGSNQHLRLWRRFHDLTHAPQVVVLTTAAATADVHVVNAHSGQQLQHEQLPYAVDKVIPVQAGVHDGAAEQFSFLLVEQDPTAADAAPRVHIYPATPAVSAAIAASSSNIFFWLQQQQQDDPTAAAGAETFLRGYSLAPTGSAESAGGSAAGDGVVAVVPAWQVVLPGRLLEVASRDPTEPVHSYVKILGDRSLKYKYINPNLLFVAIATGSGSTPAEDSPSAAAAAAGGGGPVRHDQQVSVALVNTVSGAVLHQQLHEGASGPVHAVVSEHWVAYAFRDLATMRQQVTVIELYDATPRDLSIEAIILGRTQHAARVSSYTSLQLEVLSQSFFLQHAITGMTVSQTLQGITTKQLLLHTQHDQLYALDKRYLDPRRPLAAKATPQEAEEGLIPYSELIIFNTLMFPTQDKQVLNLRGVSSTPTVLESTSLLFCYGTDLLFTRINPAAHFDSLASDFSYGLLVVALLALLVGTLVLQRTSRQSMLKAKWE